MRVLLRIVNFRAPRALNLGCAPAARSRPGGGLAPQKVFRQRRKVRRRGEKRWRASSVALHVGRKLEEEAGRYGVNFKHVYLNLRLESVTRFILYSGRARRSA